MRGLLARGRRAGPPDYVGVGTRGSGASWWHGLLLAHPAIQAARGGRELHFFEQFCAREMTDADVARYHREFPRPDDRLAGEWTPRYLGDAWAPPLLHRAAPEARLLVLLSDPVERYRSRLARHTAEDGAIKRDQLAFADAIDRGRYASQLRRLLAFYDRDRVLVLQHERCRREPAEQYARTLRFLGVADDVTPRALRRPAADAPPATPEEILWEELRAALVEELEPEVRDLCALVDDLDLGLWPEFAHLAPAPA